MIIRSYSNIDIIQGVIGYGNATEGITDWRIQNSTTGVFNISNSSSIIRPSGGTSEIGEIPGSTDRYMIFKGGTSTFTVPSGGIKCDILVVGGGGGGGTAHGGGGGAGALIYTTNQTLSSGAYTINVGNGGAAVASRGITANNGQPSSIIFNSSTIYLAIGGGGGGGAIVAGANGGSGGGGDAAAGGTALSTNTPSGTYGFAGGTGGFTAGESWSGGGGGGAGAVGGNAVAATTTFAGNGGIGREINIMGAATYYAGGGGGGVIGNPSGGYITNIGSGGNGGGGNGGKTSVGVSGLPNTGGGGGGGGFNRTGDIDYAGGAGGSGIVIIRYSTANISIIDNGNVGIGITPITASSKLEIEGGVNISGIYKKNNRNVISDTSNYALTTSNAIIPRIIADVGHGSNYLGRIATQLTTRVGNTSNYIANISSALSSGASSGVSSQWTNVSSGIHYTPALYSITSTPVATTIGTTVGASGIYTYQVFTYTTETAGAGTGQSLYTISVPTGGVICDILVVGGGGGGGSGHGGGGGAGQLVLIKDAVLNQNYTIRVGSGGIYSISQERGGARPATKGKDSTFGTIIAEGGGACTNISADKNGGSGAGGDGYTTDGGTGGFGVKDNNPDTFSSGTVYSRGNDGASNTGFTGGGGGGAGVAGNVNVGGDGLSGITEINFDFLQNFGSSVGQYISAENKVYFAGGGGGGNSGVNNGISKGGGGAGGSSTGGSGLANTGSGGGGGAGGGQDGGNGGSGIVIIRYLSSTRNVGIGTTNPTSELHVYDDTTTNTKLTVQNNNAGNPDIVITPSSGFTNVITRSGTPTKTYITYTFPINQYNLMAYYKFNGNYNDSNPSTTKYNLTATGSPDFISSETNFIQDSSVYLNANGEFLATSVNFPNTFGTSYSFWFKRNNNSTHDMLFAIGVDFFLVAHTDNKFYFSNTVGGSETYGQSSITWVNNFWYHCVFIFLSDGTWKIYINGNELIFSTLGGNYPFTAGNGKMPTGKLYIGGKNVGYWTSNDLDGYIDEFYVFNKELTQTEIINLYNKTYSVPTNTWNVRFPTTSAVTINSGSSQNVLGNYTVSVGNNSSVIPADGQVTTPYPSTAITSIAIVYEYNKTILPEVITTATGTTTRRIGDTDMCTTFTYTGTGTSTTYTFATTEALNCDILVVGGGGGGGYSYVGGGGGGGGYVYLQNINFPSGSYTVNVGSGGAAGVNGASPAGWGGNGANSSITGAINYTALGGGGGAGGSASGVITGIGNNGGSGGGGSYKLIGSVAAAGGTYTQFSTYGYGTGGNGNSYGSPWQYGGGGGGASGVTNGTSSTGNNGLANSITGVSITYAGGGGAGTDGSTIPQGGTGGGGAGATGSGTIVAPVAGTDGLGGGGGGARGGGTGVAAKGGSGIVIIRYRRINSSSLELITSSSITEPVITSVSTIIGTKQYPETPSTTANNWTDNGFTVISKTNSAILSSYDIYHLFENTLNTYYHSANLFNGSSPFNFTGSTTFKGVNGLSISIDLGRSIYIRQMRIAPWRDTPTAPLPGIFKIYASNESACWNDNNHSSWTEIHSQTTSLTFTANIYTTFGNFSTINTPYRYFTMVVYNLVGNYGWLIMSEWDILGIYNIAPVAKNNDYKYMSFTYDKPDIEQKTKVGGWRLVRFLPPTSTTWHPINDNLAGTTTYGTAYNNTNAWSIPFGTYDEFCFSTFGLRYWLYTTKYQAIGQTYDGAARTIIRSSISTSTYNAIWYNRSGYAEDPWIGLRNHGLAPQSNPDAGGDLILYGENSFSSGHWSLPAISVDGGICVWVRNSTEVQALPSQTSYIVNFPINTVCDILLVAGGGGGGGRNAGGGGAGGLVLVQNISLLGSFTINVGNGGIGRVGELPGLSGSNTTFTKSDNTIIITANGGGGGGNTTVTGGNGGSGGGGGFIYSNGTQTQKSQSQIGIVSPTILNQYGENGGHGGGGGNSYPGGGGGGAGGVGATSGGDETGQNGGLGIDRVGTFIFSEIFNINVGDNGWFAGGGGSAGGYLNTNYAYGNGGASMFGGGGNGDGVGRGIDGISGTGGGGGGIRYSEALPGGNGGSGIVIIRYRSTKIANRGYNIGNYNGDFKIVSSTYLSTSQDTDFMRITRDGASIYNPTGSPLWSTVSDRRIKENIEKASYDKCYESINKLELYRFSYIKELNNINKDLQQLGYIAQEVQSIFPKAVSTQEFHNENLSISDMLSIDITQINYSLYGAVKKLIEIDNNKEMRIKMIEYLLNIDDTSNLTLDTSNSNIALDTTTSNIALDISNSNIALDSSNSNITLDTSNSNITLDTSNSNITLDTSNSNIALDSSNSNITLDTSNSNITLDTSNSNIALDTSNSNITLDTSNSNIALDTTTSNLSN